MGRWRCLAPPRDDRCKQGEAYVGPPGKHTRAYEKAEEVSTLAGQSSLHEDVSGSA